ncbi:MAG: hypothetical protein LBN27_01960 [Prevotellaceae bacterium]|jgi:hypothetical protein|nr:hypothetical protein [Prevotellaceae bacterium]
MDFGDGRDIKGHAYNKKEFLLPEGLHSCAFYQTKIEEDGVHYKVRIHDCNRGICLNGDLSTKLGRREAVNKLNALINGLGEFRDFIYNNYLIYDCKAT